MILNADSNLILIIIIISIVVVVVLLLLLDQGDLQLWHSVPELLEIHCICITCQLLKPSARGEGKERGQRFNEAAVQYLKILEV